VAKNENNFNIIFDETCLHFLDKSPETLRKILEANLSMHCEATEKIFKEIKLREIKQFFQPQNGQNGQKNR